MAAQAGAQCHPVTACDLRGDSWDKAVGSLRWVCCKGFEAWKLQGGRRKAMERTGKPKKPAALLLCDERARGAKVPRCHGASGARVSRDWSCSGADGG